MLVVFYRRLGIYMTRHRAIIWKHDVTPKPEVHNVLQRAVRGGPSQAKRGNIHKNSAKFGRVVFEWCERTDTDRQTNKQTDKTEIVIAMCLAPPRGRNNHRGLTSRVSETEIRSMANWETNKLLQLSEDGNVEKISPLFVVVVSLSSCDVLW